MSLAIPGPLRIAFKRGWLNQLTPADLLPFQFIMAQMQPGSLGNNTVIRATVSIDKVNAQELAFGMYLGPLSQPAGLDVNVNCSGAGAICVGDTSVCMTATIGINLQSGSGTTMRATGHATSTPAAGNGNAYYISGGGQVDVTVLNNFVLFVQKNTNAAGAVRIQTMMVEVFAQG